MNILFLTSDKEPKGGWSVVGFNIIKNLQNCNIEVFSSEKKKKISFGKNRLKSELFFKYTYFTLFFDVVNILFYSKQKPDLIHCNVEFYAPVAMILSKIYKIPYTITAHGTYGVMLPVKYKIYKKAFQNAQSVITVSNFTKTRMLEEGIKANYNVIFNGVDKKKFKPNENIKKENIITFVGNLKSRKGLSFLLDSMIKVNKVRPDIKVVVIGNIDFKGKKYLATMEYIKAKKLNVEFTGKIDESELIKFYQKAKLNILPSQSEPFYFEGFGLIHIEANACGTLTIGTRYSGNEDAIAKGNGFLVKYNNTQELNDKILNVFSLECYPNIDYNKLEDWEAVGNKYLEVFNKAITQSIIL